MKKTVFIFFLLSLFVIVIAEAQLSLRGRVLQRTDSLPVYNAHIYFQGNGIGTTSNERGEFAFHILGRFKNNNITISSIGFKSAQINVGSNSKPLVIYLEEDQLMLEAITVTSVEATQILINVAANIKQNYPQEKFSKEIYYKEVFSVNDKAIRYLEIVADLVGEGFSNKKQNPYNYDLFINQKRPGFNIDSAFEGGNGIGVLHWLTGPKRYLKKSNFKNYDMELVGYTTYRNHEVFKLLVTSKGVNKILTSMYITTDNFALVAINQWHESDDRSPVLSKNIFRYLKWNEYVDFIQLDDGYWYIHTINDYRLTMDTEGDITEIKRQVKLTNVRDTISDKEKNRITRETDLYKYEIPYNPVFWQNYNAPPETEEEKRIKEEMKE